MRTGLSTGYVCKSDDNFWYNQTTSFQCDGTNDTKSKPSESRKVQTPHVPIPHYVFNEEKHRKKTKWKPGSF